LCRLDLDDALIQKLQPEISNFGLRDYKRAWKSLRTIVKYKPCNLILL
jgi:hypothetical protein